MNATDHEKGFAMWSNLRAAQAVSRVRYGNNRYPVIRVADRIPNWVNSPIIRLNRARTRVDDDKQRRHAPAA